MKNFFPGLFSIKMKAIVVFFLYLQPTSTQSQPYAIGRAAYTFTDSTRNNRSIPCEVYYPALVPAENAPVAGTPGERFPVLSFGHGFVMTVDAYRNIREAVVPAGFIIVFPKTEGGFSPSHTEFGKDLAFVIHHMRNMGEDNTSLFYQKVDTMAAIMGHSMGGGAAFLGAQDDLPNTVTVTFAPAQTNPSAIQAASNLTIPALIFAGSHDCVTPPANHQLPIFGALNATCKTYISITGGSHCYMASSNLPCSIGEASCTPAPAITREQQHQIINRYLLSWLCYHLKGDCNAGQLFEATLASDTEITFQKNCELCTVSTTWHYHKDEPARVRVFPNPFKDELKVASDSQDMLHLRFYDAKRQLIRQLNFQSTLQMSTSSLPSGMYFYEVSTAEDRLIQSGSLVKQ